MAADRRRRGSSASAFGHGQAHGNHHPNFNPTQSLTLFVSCPSPTFARLSPCTDEFGCCGVHRCWGCSSRRQPGQSSSLARRLPRVRPPSAQINAGFNCFAECIMCWQVVGNTSARWVHLQVSLVARLARNFGDLEGPLKLALTLNEQRHQASSTPCFSQRVSTPYPLVVVLIRHQRGRPSGARSGWALPRPGRELTFAFGWSNVPPLDRNTLTYDGRLACAYPITLLSSM